MVGEGELIKGGESDNVVGHTSYPFKVLVERLGVAADVYDAVKCSHEPAGLWVQAGSRRVDEECFETTANAMIGGISDIQQPFRQSKAFSVTGSSIKT